MDQNAADNSGMLTSIVHGMQGDARNQLSYCCDDTVVFAACSANLAQHGSWCGDTIPVVGSRALATTALPKGVSFQWLGFPGLSGSSVVSLRARRAANAICAA